MVVISSSAYYFRVTSDVQFIVYYGVLFAHVDPAGALI
jgi:hypothetical protein